MAWWPMLKPGRAGRVFALKTSASSLPTLRLLETLRRYGGKRLIFASSGGTVYGKVLLKPVSEDHPLNPITAYGVSKVAVEKYLGYYRDLYGLDCRIARISNPFGVGQDPSRKQGAATTFVLIMCRRGHKRNGLKAIFRGRL
jgi:UDP-glucose 4-epimerase